MSVPENYDNIHQIEIEKDPDKTERNKHSITFLILVFSCIIFFDGLLSNTPAKADITTGLVGHWTFDTADTNWNTTTLNDVTGTNNGLLNSFYSSTSTVSSGYSGEALKFDGGNDYVRIDSPYNTSTSTISFWVKTVDGIRSGLLGVTSGVVTTSDWNFFVFLDTQIKYYKSGYTVGTSVSTDTWHMVSLVNSYNPGTNAQLTTLYIDGAYVTSSTAAYNTGSNTYMYLGANFAAGPTAYYDGYMDDLRVYDRALSSSDVLELFNAGKSAPTVTSGVATNIKMTAALLTGNITNDGNTTETDRGFKYGLTSGYGSVSSTTGTFSTGAFQAQLTGLICNTTYHFASFATNSVGTVTSADRTFTTGACATVVPNGLVGWYKFDDNTGTTAIDSVGVNDATMYGSTNPTWSSGILDRSLKFNGVDNYVRASAAAYDTNTSSISFWAKVIDSNDRTLVSVKDGTPSSTSIDVNIFSTDQGGNPRINYYRGTYFTGQNVTAIQWHLITLVNTNTNDSSLYIDGSLVTTSTHTHDTASTRYIYVGAGFSGYSNAFIDDLRIYNRVLTTQDITDIYNDGLNASQSSDVDPPVESQSAPSSILTSGTTQTTLSIITNENATCKYGTSSGVSYASQPNTFTTSDNLHFSATVSTQPGHNYFYVRCQDTSNNTNISDFVADAQVYKTCSFTGVHNWYVDPNGESLNCGTLNDPWDLTTALKDNTNSSNRNYGINAGDTVWLKAGAYRTSYAGFNSQLQGSTGNYITVRPYNNGRAILYEMLTVNGQYVTFRNLEFTEDFSPHAGPATYADRSAFDADLGVNYPYGGWAINVDNVKMINNLEYGTYGTGASGSDYLYGNIILDTGYYFADGTGADEGMYNHNDHAGGDAGQIATYQNNIISKGVRTGLNMWSASNSEERYLHAIGNIVTHLVLNLRSGSTLVHDNIVQDNIVASMTTGGDKSLTYPPGIHIGWANHAPLVKDTTVSNNLVINGNMILNNLVDTSVTGNTIISDSGSSPTRCFDVYTTPVTSTMGTNTCYGSNNTTKYSLDSSNYNFANYLSNMSGLDTTSQFINSQYPTTNQIYYFPNAYDDGRMNIFIANYELLNSVSLDLSTSGLALGQSYEIHFVDNYFGSTVTGVYDGSPITFPMNTWTIAQPQFLTDARAAGQTQYALYTNPTPLWGAFVVLPGDMSSDTTDPSVSMTAPSAGTVSGSSVALSASATDNVAIAGVTFWYDSTKIGSEITSPSSGSTYSSTWDSTAISNGSHILKAVARDTSGNYATSSTVTVTVSNNSSDNTVPVVSLDSPSAGTVSGSSVALSSTATDNVAIAGVTFWYNSTKIGSEVSSPSSANTYTSSWDSTSVSNGTYTLSAVARDTSNNRATSTITVTVNNSTPDITVPVISLDSPSAGTISGSSVSLSSTATDDTAIAGVTFWYDSTKIGSEVNSPSSANTYTSTWDSTSVSNGSYTLSAVARDTSNNRATSTVSVNVSNISQSGGGGGGGGGGGVNTSVGGGSTYTPPPIAFATATTTVCKNKTYPLINTLMYSGVVGANVTLLQKILIQEKLLTKTTGIYDALTSKAVSTFQMKYNIVSGGTAATTGLGLVGTKTKTAINLFINQGKYPSLLECTSTATSSNTTVVKTPAISTYNFTKSLALGSVDPDVKALQVFLNTHGYTVAVTGNGSLGHETSRFGILTQQALIRFQKAQKITPAVGFFGPLTRAKIKALGY